MQYIPFDEALRISEEHGGVKHLLLGNGFSIAKDTLFSYSSIFDRPGSIPKSLENLFAIHNKNPEKVIEELEIQLKYRDIRRVKQAFIETFIKNIHPPSIYTISENQRASCSAFFAHFDNIYTTNYDLLSYWINVGFSKEKILKDGFRRDNTKGYDDPLVCKYGKFAQNANFHYLHGAIHLFEYFKLNQLSPQKIWQSVVYIADFHLHKLSYSEIEGALLKQVRRHFANRQMPLIVMEGTSQNKLKRMYGTPYLHMAYKNFKHLTQNMYGIIGRNLFIFGHSLSEQDQHILDAIRESHTDNIFCSYLNSGDPVIPRVKTLESEETKVYLFQCDTAHVWNNPSVIESSKKNNQNLVLMS